MRALVPRADADPDAAGYRFFKAAVELPWRGHRPQLGERIQARRRRDAAIKIQLSRFALRVHGVADGAGGGAKFRIRAVCSIDEAALVGFAVAAADERLVAPLEPVASDDERMRERAFHEARVVSAALRLVAHGAEARLEHPAIHASKVEFADEYRLVHASIHYF